MYFESQIYTEWLQGKLGEVKTKGTGSMVHSRNPKQASLAASPSPPGRSRAHARRSRAEGGEGLANFAVD